MTSSKRERYGVIALRWWSDLQSRRADGTRNPTGNPGALAELRRVATSVEAAEHDAAIGLFDRLFPGRSASDFGRLVRVGTLASILAHVRDHDKPGDGRWPSVARAVGQQSNGDSARLSPLRFRRLLAARSDDEILTSFRRLVSLAGRRLNVIDLAESTLEWNDDEIGDRRRVRWAFDYYNAGNATPGATITNPSPVVSEQTS